MPNPDGIIRYQRPLAWQSLPIKPTKHAAALALGMSNDVIVVYVILTQLSKDHTLSNVRGQLGVGNGQLIDCACVVIRLNLDARHRKPHQMWIFTVEIDKVPLASIWIDIHVGSIRAMVGPQIKHQ